MGTSGRRIAAASILGAALAIGGSARASDARVTVGNVPQRGYAEPPARDAGIAYDEERDREPLRQTPPRELYRSPFRLQLGPAGVTTGAGLGLGMNLAVDVGAGTVGARFSAAWLRGEGASSDVTSRSPLGRSLGQYTAEMTLDLHKRGPLHPVIGLGFGLVHVSKPEGGGVAGIGTARAGLDYALGLEDADVRVGASVTGALAGPADDELATLRGYALLATTLSIGF